MPVGDQLSRGKREAEALVDVAQCVVACGERFDGCPVRPARGRSREMHPNVKLVGIKVSGNGNRATSPALLQGVIDDMVDGAGNSSLVDPE